MCSAHTLGRSFADSQGTAASRQCRAACTHAQWQMGSEPAPRLALNETFSGSPSFYSPRRLEVGCGRCFPAGRCSSGTPGKGRIFCAVSEPSFERRSCFARLLLCRPHFGYTQHRSSGDRVETWGPPVRRGKSHTAA